ncbi:MAG: hypothetical protein LBV51_05020 [Acholeplasmatales bacterium]|jgi:vacuolar-type H+-ATPase subunit F/Vma7|nr:hypothetical protein [Acholeplasmatales bacterium]
MIVISKYKKAGIFKSLNLDIIYASNENFNDILKEHTGEDIIIIDNDYIISQNNLDVINSSPFPIIIKLPISKDNNNSKEELLDMINKTLGMRI